MECHQCEPYVPLFQSPYPEQPRPGITEFGSEAPLHLCRCPDVAELGDGKAANFIVSQPYSVHFKLDGALREITVPQGMVTDLTSVPRLARWFISRVGRHLEATIVHDFLYIAWQDLENQPIDEKHRRFADNLLFVAMKAADVNWLKIWVVYLAVRAFGAGAYVEPDDVRYVKDQ